MMYRDKEFLFIKRLVMFPLLASWNKFVGTRMEAPLHSPITKAAYRGYTQNK
jgi:hypothetical protein